MNGEEQITALAKVREVRQACFLKEKAFQRRLTVRVRIRLKDPLENMPLEFV